LTIPPTLNIAGDGYEAYDALLFWVQLLDAQRLAIKCRRRSRCYHGGMIFLPHSGHFSDLLACILDPFSKFAEL
jgi:hypothetical protein